LRTFGSRRPPTDSSKVDKINELIDSLNEKDRLLEKQEVILYEEHDKLV
jgi:N-acetylglutamate synthase-like GNAT family acetyltransferase